jgi:molecular chaperone GrpE
MEQPREEALNDLDKKKEPDSCDKLSEPTPGREALQKQYEELNDRYLRLAADFDNFRKRVARDMGAQIDFAIEGFAVELLEVADNFDRALSAEESSAKEGLIQIAKLFRSILERHGIKPIESMGMKFDPEVHEAMACIHSANEEGTVIDEVCCGYTMRDKVIRHARVAVSKGKESD